MTVKIPDCSPNLETIPSRSTARIGHGTAKTHRPQIRLRPALLFFRITPDTKTSKPVNSSKEVCYLCSTFRGEVRLVPAETYEDDMWEKTIDINLNGAFKISREVARAMIDNKNGGSFVYVASMSGPLRPIMGGACLVASSIAVSYLYSVSREQVISRYQPVFPKTWTKREHLEDRKWIKGRFGVRSLYSVGPGKVLRFVVASLTTTDDVRGPRSPRRGIRGCLRGQNPSGNMPVALQLTLRPVMKSAVDAFIKGVLLWALQNVPLSHHAAVLSSGRGPLRRITRITIQNLTTCSKGNPFASSTFQSSAYRAGDPPAAGATRQSTPANRIEVRMTSRCAVLKTKYNGNRFEALERGPD
ncbi:hypothetical protein BU16DRAFT_587194 [Lophium mytilinum]|uniref:NAD(P)-binding protein n=1 Tax=Lophium mytilinum TaxID=390894 RepID=A0A6A6RBQ0_9PEZI|nr:hypothetical protein BU16DRAFT_587194 [Lophium mytilinum]